ncbi:MAG: glycosyltransferase [Candidatus Saccharibacteria bacterium]|nr:glycosyltransferase [Candidatus Saccharibacteria bacterium]
MKIAIFSDCYLDLTGGITTSITAEKAELEKRGHTVYIFSSAYPRSKQEARKLASKNIFPVPSCRFFMRGLTPISRCPKAVMHWCEKNFPELKNFDIFYIHYEAGCSIAGLKLAKKYKRPAIQVMHGREDMGETNIIPLGLRTAAAYVLSLLHSYYIPHKIQILKDDYLADSLAKAKMWSLMVNHANFADLVITPSKHFAEKLIHYGVTRKIVPLPNGIDDELFLPDLKPRILKSNEPLKIIWHSRVSAEKRIMPFLHALTKVNGKYRLDVYGGGGDFFRAKRFARHHKINVIFHGNTNFGTVYKAITKSHLDVLVSDNFDTFGMTLIEAESVGVPTLIADPDLTETVPKGGYVLARSSSPDDMATAISELISHPEHIEKMSKILLKNRDSAKISRKVDKLEQMFNSRTLKAYEPSERRARP